MRCDQEMCPHWSGDGDVCPCAVFNLDRPTRCCYIDDCGQPATLVVPSYPDTIRLCADHAYLYDGAR